MNCNINQMIAPNIITANPIVKSKAVVSNEPPRLKIPDRFRVKTAHRFVLHYAIHIIVMERAGDAIRIDEDSEQYDEDDVLFIHWFSYRYFQA